MKTVLLTVAALVFVFASVDSSAWYKRVAKDGRQNGGGAVTYRVVSVETDNWGTSIWCEGDGNNGCPYSASGVTQQEADARDYALSQISAGTLTGDTYAPNGKRVKWAASGSSNPTTCNIWVWGVSEGVPSDFFSY